MFDCRRVFVSHNLFLDKVFTGGLSHRHILPQAPEESFTATAAPVDELFAAADTTEAQGDVVDPEMRYPLVNIQKTSKKHGNAP